MTGLQPPTTTGTLTISVIVNTNDRAEPLRTLAAAHHMLHARELKFRPAPNMPPLTLQAVYPPAFEEILESI